ncbi:MAG: biotin/lipoyl-binding protein [Acidobacteria bacterium]|nr:biotin/lipoyl-binding protein [Acidobacteriota bacterium]
MDVGASRRMVTVHREADVFRVTVDGQAYVVDVRRINGTTLSMLLPGHGRVAARQSVEASLVAGASAGALEIQIAGYAVPVQLISGSGRGNRATPATSASGSQKIVAPMPGKIVRVLVKVGDRVAARQGMVVIEAMKMENELKAARGGLVREVSAIEGQLVEAGTALVTVE